MSYSLIFDLVKRVNEELEETTPGAFAIQKKPSIGSSPAFFGYRSQVVFSTVSKYLNWESKIDKIELGENRALVQVTVIIHLESASFSHAQWGGSIVVKGDRGNALKGATTDAIQKALSLFGIGERAYLGLLEENWTKNQQSLKSAVPKSSSLFEKLLEEIADKNLDERRKWWRKKTYEIRKLTPEERDRLIRELTNESK